MKKTVSLLALGILFGVEVLTPITYAQNISEKNFENIEENLVEEFGQDFQKSEDSLKNVQEDGNITEIGQSEEDPQLLESQMEDENVKNEKLKLMGRGLPQIQNLGASEIDLTNPIHLYRNGELTGTYTGLSQAINEAESGDIISLINDISVSETSVISGKSLTIDGDNHTITRIANIRTITVNEGSSLKLLDVIITDNAVNFAPNRYDSLLTAKSNIPLCLGGVNEIRDESGEVTASVCATDNVDTAKTNPQIYSVGDIYGEDLIISNSLNSKGSAAIIVEKGGIEMVSSNFIHNGANGTSNAGRGGAIRVGPLNPSSIDDESPITKIIFSGCLFENNYGRSNGGALSLIYAPENITIDNCVFSGNTAYYNGGAINIPNINYKAGQGGGAFIASGGNIIPIGTLYINNSDFYSNRCGNDGAAIENDDINLQIDSSNFEHNYGTQPGNTSVGVISCQAGGGAGSRGSILRTFNINNSKFLDTNTSVLGDHNMLGAFFVDNCSFEKQSEVILSYNGIGEIKNSIIKNSNSFGKCGDPKSIMYDISIIPRDDHMSWINRFGEIVFKLENNTYSNDCTTNMYFPIRSINYTTGDENIIIENEGNTRMYVNRNYYDSVKVRGSDEIYYGATISGQNYAYIKKDKFYNFDEFNVELEKWSTGYQLQSGKAMLFYLDSGYTELWSGSISTTTNLYGKETDVYNIIYEGIDGINFEGITHTYKFINLDHTQYLTELTPYTLNTPSRNGYKFEGRFLDSGYTIPVTSIEVGSTGDITLYAKWEKLGYSGGGGGGGSSKTDTPKQEEKSEKNPQNNISTGDSVKNPEEEDSSLDSQNGNQNTQDSSNQFLEGQYSTEFQQAYEFAKGHGITTMPTIQKADMEGNLTRIQMAKMLSHYAINVLGKTPDVSKNNKFRDVSDKEDADYDYGVTLAYQLGIMGQNMLNNKFRPNDEVTRAEFVAAFSRMLYGTLDGEYKSTSKYYTHHMEKLKSEGIVTNTNPSMKERRGYVMIMLMRSAK